MALAVQPSRLVLSSVAVQPAGNDRTARATRSKNVVLRVSVSGTTTAPPASPTAAGFTDPMSNVPSDPSLETSSSFSCLRVRIRGDLPVPGAEVLERLLDLGRRRHRAAGLVERDGAGHGRGRHRRARRVAIGRPGLRRPDALAGRDEIDVVAVVAEVRERVVLVVAAPRVAALPARAAGFAVRIGEGRDRDDLVVGGRDLLAGIGVVVRGSGDHGHAPGDEPADGLVEDVLVGEAAVRVVLAGLGDAHVHRLEERPAAVVRVVPGEDPVEPADVPREVAVAIAVEDLDRPEARARGDADDPEVVVERRDRAGDVRAVAVVVRPGRAIRAGTVVATGDVQVGVRPDARVDDGDIRIHALVQAIDVGDERLLGADARHPGRDGLGGQVDDLVGDDRDDVGVTKQGSSLARIERGREPAERTGERAVRTDRGPVRNALDLGRRVRARLQDDDEAPGRVEAAVGLGR